MKKCLFKVLALAFVLVLTSPSHAQCPMCKIGAESNLKAGGSAANGLNSGILYMLAMPYLLVTTVGFIWYKNRKKESEQLDN